MLCQICNKRPANVHVTKIINGAKNELHICEQCAKEKEGLKVSSEIPGFDTPFSFSNILAGFMDFAGVGILPYSADRAVKCTGCNLDYEDFKKTGRFGCSQCYEFFGNKLDPIFKRIHGNIQHTGKVPKRTGGLIRTKRDIERLRYDLKKAIESEEYEHAAELRDNIKQLENKEV